MSHNFDPSREQLNFEVKPGGIITPLDKSDPIDVRIKKNLKERGIKDPNEGLFFNATKSRQGYWSRRGREKQNVENAMYSFTLMRIIAQNKDFTLAESGKCVCFQPYAAKLRLFLLTTA